VGALSSQPVDNSGITIRNRGQPEEQRKEYEPPLFLWLFSVPLYPNLCFLAFDVR
jgi:hypothetical protein